MISTGDIPTPIRNIIKLYIQDARMELTERLTRLVGSLVVSFLLVMVIFATLIFASIAGAHELRNVVTPGVAYLIVFCCYLVLLAVLLIFKRQLIINPLARLLSRTLLTNPKKSSEDE